MTRRKTTTQTNAAAGAAVQETMTVNFLQNIISATIITTLLLVLVGLALGSATQAPDADKVNYAPVAAGTYNFDANHTIIGFGVKHLEIAIVEGRFKDLSGTVTYDDKDVTKSSVEFTAKIDSIDTGVAARDAHLRTPDFFDVAKYPTMTFKSTRVEKKGKDLVLHGDLTIKGVTKQVSFPFTMTGAVKDPWGGTRFGIAASTTINRRDFGITWGNTLPLGGIDVANQVAVDLHIEAVRAEAK